MISLDIREAIVNAIVHRDYSITGAKIELEITPEKIEVRSPGEPVSPNSISDLKNFTAVSYARNSDLAYVFNIMRLMEESGVGMDTFKSLRAKYDLPLPIITASRHLAKMLDLKLIKTNGENPKSPKLRYSST